ncbi:hypothetical protein EJ03DRAFT_120557 [Teratosphaeria nubilosa]|uniref:Uncharacterized protein n=1 Tax=Teratosphaeria nubilosa TaxID=161662 RepID=A0A6G1L6J5_9PEZI|nr:hypothetical protein EJ03DRAFT_120557 [Teratosphaeria nubilosa]
MQTPELVFIIGKVMSSSKFPKKPGSEGVETDPKYRYQKVGETLKDWINITDQGNAERYVNFELFQAAVYADGLFEDRIESLTYAMDLASGRQQPTSTTPKFLSGCGHEHEADALTVDQEARDVYLLSAAEWICEYGAVCYAQLAKQPVVAGVRDNLWSLVQYITPIASFPLAVSLPDAQPNLLFSLLATTALAECEPRIGAD